MTVKGNIIVKAAHFGQFSLTQTSITLKFIWALQEWPLQSRLHEDLGGMREKIVR